MLVYRKIQTLRIFPKVIKFTTHHKMSTMMYVLYYLSKDIIKIYFSGTLDQVSNLKLLVAHAGAALPSLIMRLDSCVAHDVAIANRLQVHFVYLCL